MTVEQFYKFMEYIDAKFEEIGQNLITYRSDEIYSELLELVRKSENNEN